MASAGKPNIDDGRRGTSSPKLKGRDHAKDTLCRNVTIYGRCRYEDKGCVFNHDPSRVNDAQHPESRSSSKKRFNVDSPSFTPSATPLNGSSGLKKSATISPKAANAAPFLPKGVLSRSNAATPQSQPETSTPEWSIGEIQDFVPQGFDTSHVESIHGHGNGVLSTPAYDPFVSSSTPLGASGAVTHQVQPNPYSHDPSAIGGAAFFGAHNAFQQPVQYHLYAPIGPHNQNILGYQRNIHDLFLPNSFREELQKKAAATLQTLPNSQLPTQIDYFHSLVPLDLSHQKNAAIFGYPSWVYKAQSSKDGNFYALRRLEADGQGRYQGRHTSGHIPEQILWSYVTQIANALKAIHSAGLAARVIEPSKILLTGKNRIRLNACGILDVVQFDSQRPLADLQHQDLVNFGQLILTLGANSPSLMHNPTKATEHFNRSYSAQLNNSVYWLLSGMQKDQERTIDIFISGISSQLMSTFDSSLHLDDQLISDLSRELENARLVRLLTKLNFINERPEYEHDRQWSENGERYFLKLFRDYVFHQVDAQNAPVVDLGHVLTCLNKLDAGTDEKVTLISRDEQSCFIVSYKELKKAVEASFQALLKPARRI
ncbi:PABP-dependent poly(A) nuclease 3 [Coccidioides immitis H538.4]|uniref:PAN2-PAN3 deadenylation complex subunit PAN3 n=2 Tax=Coccidioides immitis TaxID=5501 RepID=A0A0J8U5V6_COCIT|nr:PABP-dependent poly(A) nuclease 3 [Coccidioides immitis RMSCC 2394]KMU82393.1 PABP-dependent poly(A) nuclease 3 [Coccidioides immitis H538.4]